MYTNTSVTLYLYSNGEYIRKNIDKAFWDERKASNVLKSGIANADSLKVFIPYTGDINFSTSKDLIVKGEVNYQIDTTTEKTIAESKQYLIQNYETYTITSCDKKLYGSPNMQHYELSCK